MEVHRLELFITVAFVSSPPTWQPLRFVLEGQLFLRLRENYLELPNALVKVAVVVLFEDRLLVTDAVSPSVELGILRVEGRATWVVVVSSTRPLAGPRVTTLDLAQASFPCALVGTTVELALAPQQNALPLPLVLPVKSMLVVVFVSGS